MEEYSRQTWTPGVTAADDVTLPHIEVGIYGARLSTAGFVALDDPAFGEGNTDQQKLVNAMNYCQGQSFKPGILLGNRRYTFTGSLGQVYDGFMLVGTGRGWLNPEIGIRHTEVSLSVAGGSWLVATTEMWNIYIEGINFIAANNTTQFLSSPSSTAAVWASTFHNLTFQNFKGVFGNGTTTCFTDLCTWSGNWQILSCQDTAINIGGADNREMWSHGMNIGSGSTPVAGGGENFLIKFRGNSKATVGPIYLTADNAWRGILCTGSSSSGYGLVITGIVDEGRNPGDPCSGNLLRIEGGTVTLRDANVNCGMAAPSGTALSNPNGIADRGLIEVVGTDSQLTIDGLTVSHATGVPNTTPILYAAGIAGQVKVRIRNVQTSLRSGGTAWSGQLPVVKQSVTGLVLDSDTSVAVSVG